jgi:hypothetical protein
VCRPANGDCDVAESCTGTTAACPADGFAPSTTTCRPSIGPCDVAEQCTGTAPNCPADSVSGAFVECRAAAGSCDVAESCDGSSDACPPDQLEPATTVCRPAGGDCDLAESCTGSSADCPADAFAPATTVCRPPAGAFDVAESCPGTGPSCPADQKSSGVCRAAAGTCDVAESCDGASNDCPPDSFVPVGTTCRAASGFCDVAEVCTGIGAACPPDVTLPDGTACNDANVCTAPDTCQAGACTGAPQPGTCVDHYLSYKIKPTTPFTLVPNVHLVDQFEDIHVDVIKVRNLCTPVDKNGEGVIDDGTHLASYTFKPVPGTPKFIRRTNVRIDNQLGTLFVDAYKRDLLLVPTNKSLTGPTTPPDNTAIGVDHYKCYKVKTSAGTPRFSPTTVGVADQFTAPAKSFVLKKIKHLCTPVDKNGEGLKNADAHLACYQAKPASGQPKHQRRLGVNIANQFGSLVLGTIKESELCVPSIKTLTP